MRRFALIAFAVLAGAGSTVRAQTPEDSVRAVVQGALDQLATRDTAQARGLFTPSAMLVLVSYTPDSTILRTIPIAAINASLQAPGPQRREELRSPRVVVVGDLATVSGTYVFYYDAVLHHCGEAMYDLVRSQGRWRISAIRESDHRTGCMP